MYSPINQAFLSEFEKLAKTRAAAEWQAAHARGDTGMTDSIAGVYGKLGLRPRYLKDVSPGGAEAGVDLMMGAPMGKQLPGGYVARKMYKPDSILHRGEVTRAVLNQKQLLTDKAKKIAPQHVVGMAGFEQVGRTTGDPRFVSYHEYVPKFKEFDQVEARHGYGATIGPLGELEQNVLNPMSRRGMKLNDVYGRFRDGVGIEAQDFPTHFAPQVNPGNVAFVQGSDGKYTAKVMDFLPKIEGQADIARNFQRAQEWKDRGKIRGPSKYDARDGIGELRKDVFRKKKPSGFLTPALKKGLLIGGGAALLGGGAYLAHRLHQRATEKRAA